jgi:DUF4097 and DUF4098 domain-containing protein YvlB
MSRRQRRLLRIAAPVGGALIAILSAFAQHAGAQQGADEWLERCRDRDGDDDAVHCEVRESTLAAARELQVDAAPNGGITVTAWDRSDIRVVARIQTRAPTAAEAREIASGIRIETAGGRVSADGPDTRNRRGWSVSYVISAPRGIDLDLSSVNGGLSVDGIRGELDLRTTNGGIDLDDIGGTVRAHTTNGGIDARLVGSGWSGEGLDLETTNGGISLTVPANFNARLTASTVHGGLDTDFPMTVQGRIGRRVDATLGSGGPPVSLETTNGGIEIRRR